MATTPLTDLAVVNMALGRVGAETIDAIDDTTPAGVYAGNEYPQCKAWLLGKYRWAFATGLAQLALVEPAPANAPATFAYAPPADLVGAIHAYRDGAHARASRVRAWLVNGYIASDAKAVWAEYTRLVPEAQWPVWFVELVKTVFAAGVAGSVGQNQGLANTLVQTAFGTPAEMGEGGLYAQCRNEDARMAPPREAFSPWDDGVLVSARYGWGLPGVGGAYSFPFVGLPGSFGPPTFIDFSGDFVLDESPLGEGGVL